MRHGIKKKALRRLKILEGQVRGLQRMVANEEYCIDILTQSSAVKEALSGIEDLILENHLSTHVIEMARAVRHDDIRLGKFFEIWGEQFSSTCILDSCNGSEGTVKMFVNGKENTEFENYYMQDKDRIDIRYE